MKNQDLMVRPEAAPAAVTASSGFDISAIDIESMKRKLAAIGQFQALVGKHLKKFVDFGPIPGTGEKPTLLKPGAEKIAKLLNCYDDYEIVSQTEEWNPHQPFFRYLFRCVLIEMATGTRVSSGLGECNSMESKYRWRWVAAKDIPASLDREQLQSKDGRMTLFEFNFALEKRETTGQYGKPAEHWAKFDEAIKAGTHKQVERETKTHKKYWGVEIVVGETFYRIPNPDIYDQVNTLIKMAKKRALVDAALSAGRLSDLFTQDLEDLYHEAFAKAAAEDADGGAEGEKKDAAADGGKKAEADAPPRASAKPTPKPAPKAAPAADAPPASGDRDFPQDEPSRAADAVDEGKPELQAPEAKRVGPEALKRISDQIVALSKMKSTPEGVLEFCYKVVKEKFGTTFIETAELTEAEAEYLIGRLDAWIEDKRRRGVAGGGK